jgi:hypothetical protein
LNQAAEDGQTITESSEETKESDKMAVVKQDVRLNNRIIDLRVPAN